MGEIPGDVVLVAPTREDVKAVADEIRTGNCILFIGAGVHSTPPAGSFYQYRDDVRPLRGGELAKHLAEASGYPTEFPTEQLDNLGRIGQYCEMRRDLDRAWLVSEIREKVQNGKEPSPALRALAAMDFRFIATTNYDTLFEDALRDARKKPYIAVYDKDRFHMTADYLGDKPSDEPSVRRPFLLKMHGDIEHPESLVITDEDYIHFVLRMGSPEAYHPVPASFRLGFSRLPTLFIGYSLLDYNLRLLFKTLRWQVDNARRPKAYAVDPFPDRIIQGVYDDQNRLIQFIVLDLWSFVPMLYRELNGVDLPTGVEVGR